MSTNLYTQARETWEQQQKNIHGCRYVSGICVVHGGAAVIRRSIVFVAKRAGDSRPTKQLALDSRGR
jgi:hypothetical protein